MAAAVCLLSITRFASGQDAGIGPASPASAASIPAAAAVAKSSTEGRALGGPAAAQPTSGRPAKPDATAAAPRKSWLGQTVVSLAGVLALMAVAAGVIRVIARRTGGLGGALGPGGRAPAGIMEILGRYPIGRGATLVLLKLDRRILLLSQTAGGRFGAGAALSKLCDITDADEVASILVKARDAEGDSMSERFRSILGRFDRTMASTEEEASGRKVLASPSGDRAELWDERNAIPVVDLTRQPGPPDASAAGSLRRRLASMRWTGPDGGKRA
jgi:hypothetical protein